MKVKKVRYLRGVLLFLLGICITTAMLINLKKVNRVIITRSYNGSQSHDSWCKVTQEIKDPTFKRQVIEDPTKYKGWSHPWWTPYKSSNLIDYVDVDNLITFDTNDCDKDTWDDGNKHIRIFMMLHSNPNEGGEKARNDNRQTWMKFLRDFPFVKVNFVIGLPRNASQQLNLWKEQQNHCDLIQFNFIDSYYNATVKTAHSIQYFYRYPWNETSTPPEFMLRGDDDIYVNIPKLVEVLNPYLTKRYSDQYLCISDSSHFSMHSYNFQ